MPGRAVRLFACALIALSLGALLSPALAAADPPMPTFELAGSTLSNGQPVALIAADFNHDGLDEVLASNYVGSSLSLFPNNSNSVLEPPDELSLPGTARTPVAVDLNSDGDLDIAVAMQSSNSIGVLLGNGDGTFQPCVSTLVAFEMFGLAAGDIDRDGQMDLVSTSMSDGGVYTLYGDGTGGFSHTSAQASGLGAGSVVVADLNGDGWLDAAVASRYAGWVGVHVNSAGVLGPRTGPTTFITLGTQPFEVRTGDMDRDGDIDLVTANNGGSGGACTVLLNDGAADFSSKIAIGDDTGLSAINLALGDVNADGILDIATAVNNLSQMRVYYGTGDGMAWEATGARKTVAGPWSVLLDDINNDGLLDMAGAAYSSAVVNVFGNTTSVDRGYGFAAPATPSAGQAPYMVDTGDFDRDGKPDVLAATANYGATLMFGDGLGGVRSSMPISVDGVTVFCARFVDLDRDGWLDIVVADYGSNGLTYWRNNHAGGVTDVRFAACGDSPVWIDIADVNRDGAPDVAVSLMISDRIQLRLNDGAGVLSGETNLLMPAGTSWPNTCKIADINQDGVLDVLATNSSGTGAASIWLGSGGGAFDSPVTVGMGTRPHGIGVEDMDRDGHLDLVVPNADSDSIWVKYGDGSGTNYTALRVLTVGDQPIGATSVDVNRDGLLDIVTGDYGSKTMSVYLNAGNRTFFQRPDIALPSAPHRGPSSADFNRDGVPDLAQALVDSSQVAIVLGTPTATPGRLAGFVTENGAALGNVRVYVTGMPYVWTDSTGHYSVPFLDSGTYSVEFSKNGYSTVNVTGVSITSNATTGLDQTMSLAPATFYGTVTEKGTGNLLGGVEIEVRNRDTDALVASGSSLADGSFSIGGIAPDTYTVVFHKDGYVDHVGHNYLIYNGQGAYSPEMEKAGALEGTVTRTSDGVPLAGVAVQVGALTSTTTDAGGHYLVTGIPEGSYSLLFSLGEYQMKQLLDVAIVGGTTTTQDVALTHEPETLVAAIDSPATGTTVVQGTNVTFTGHLASDTFGHSATDSEWRSSIDGLLAEDAASFSKSSLSVGAHTISMRVKCTGGTWSPYATIQLDVVAPTADAATGAIDSPAATICYVGDAVSFAGHLASDTKGHPAAVYEWRSSISGTLSGSASFSTSSLVAGTHTIYFRVKCAGGVWSPDQSVIVTVLKRPVTLSTPKVSGKPTAKKGTTLTGTVLPGHAARVTLEVQRYSKGKYRAYKKYYVTSSATGSYKYKAKPKKGTYRVRAITTTDAKWLAKTTSWRKVVVK